MIFAILLAKYPKSLAIDANCSESGLIFTEESPKTYLVDPFSIIKPLHTVETSGEGLTICNAALNVSAVEYSIPQISPSVSPKATIVEPKKLGDLANLVASSIEIPLFLLTS